MDDFWTLLAGLFPEQGGGVLIRVDQPFEGVGRGHGAGDGNGFGGGTGAGQGHGGCMDTGEGSGAGRGNQFGRDSGANLVSDPDVFGHGGGWSALAGFSDGSSGDPP